MLALDTVLIAGVFRLLSGLRASGRSLWIGALIGGVGLLVLQELSGLFIGGATSNPLLASFADAAGAADLAQPVDPGHPDLLRLHRHVGGGTQDRVHARFGATTFPQRRVQRAEAEVALATSELRAAQQAEREARLGSDDD